MSDNCVRKKAKVCVDKTVNFIDFDLVAIAGATHSYGELNFNIFGSCPPEKQLGNFLSFCIDQNYLFVTSKTKQGFMVIKIDNSTPLTDSQLSTSQALLNLHYYFSQLKKDPNIEAAIFNKYKNCCDQTNLKKRYKELCELIKKVNKAEIETILLLADNTIQTEEPKEFTEEELQEIAEVYDKIPTITPTPSIILKLDENGISVLEDEFTGE